MYGVAYPIPLFPSHVGLRAAPVRWLDFGIDLGPLETGLQLRAGPLDAARPLPWGVELEWRSGLLSLANWFRKGGELPVALSRNVLRLRGELYPPLGGRSPESGLPRSFGMLALGASVGRELASIVNLPRAFESNEAEGPWPSQLLGLRWEARLEAAVGVQLRTEPDHRYMLVLMPWLTLHRGKMNDRDCGGCSLEILEIASGGGLTLALAGSWKLK
jgi:hypothetical protein